MTNTVLIDLNLSGAIGPEDLFEIEKGLTTNSTLTTFHLTGLNRQEEVNFEDLRHFLMTLTTTNPNLTSLHLSDNNLGNDEAVALAAVLAAKTTGISLYLSGNAIEANGATALITDTPLIELDLRFNSLSNEMESFATALENNTVLTSLDLSYNQFSIETVTRIIKSLAKNSVLTTLKITSDFGAEKQKSLAEALQTNYSLTRLDFSDDFLPQESLSLLLSRNKTLVEERQRYLNCTLSALLIPFILSE